MSRGSVSGVLLAAGRSRRFGGSVPKQLALFHGEPLVRRAARTALAAGLAEVLAVTGWAGDEVAAALAGLPVRRVSNPAWAEGQSTSVRAGLAEVAPDTGAALFLPCDQPLLTAAVIDALIAAWRAGGGRIIVPVFRGRRGTPTLFDRALFAELAAVTGDEGGRQVIARRRGDLVEVELEEEAPLLDVDTAEALARLERAEPGAV